MCSCSVLVSKDGEEIRIVDGDCPEHGGIERFIETLFGPLPEQKRCMNCGEVFNPNTEDTYWYVCSEKCSREAADALNKQKGLHGD